MTAPDCTKRTPRGSCIQRLASGWMGPSDLCPACTRRFMGALDGLGEPLDWHSEFARRATRTGYETFTGDRHPVVFDPARAAAGLPAWTSTLDGQHFTDSEVVEDARGGAS